MGVHPRNLLNLLNLMLKLMYIESLGTSTEVAQRMKLPRRLVDALLTDATQQLCDGDGHCGRERVFGALRAR